MATFEKAENIEYNADGNIVVYGENSYVYDGLGRLIRENNKALDKTFLFEYNVGGNIMYRSEFPYTTGAVGTVTKICDYYYNNTWKDQLTSYDNKAITYDASGNPTSYMGKTLTWSRGRLLTKYVISPLFSISMQYDANGIRCSKTKFAAGPTLVGAYTTTNYTYDSEGRLRCESDDTYTRYFIYGADGIVGYEENGVQFMYRKNLFGDITAIYQGTTKVAEYVYDAWGNCTVTTNVNGYGTRNPFRYRGYYFDTDLNMYYLMTRYYDPQTSRFINADSLDYLDPNTINGLNLYAYCGNNPIMRTDVYGNVSELLLTTLVFLGVGTILGAVLGALADYPLKSNIDADLPIDLPFGTNKDEEVENEELTFEDRLLNTVKGALLGAWVGSSGIMVTGIVVALCGSATGVTSAIGIGVSIFAFGTALSMILAVMLGGLGIKVEAPDEDPTGKYETGLPQMK